MTYQLTESGSIKRTLENGATQFLPAKNNGTSAWAEYQEWLSEGNTPEPAPPPPAPGPDYLAFWEGLLAASVYQTIRAQAATNLAMNTAATEFIALIGDAKAGRAYEAAIQGSIDAILASGTFSEDELIQFQVLLGLGNLDGIYTLGGAS